MKVWKRDGPNDIFLALIALSLIMVLLMRFFPPPTYSSHRSLEYFTAYKKGILDSYLVMRDSFKDSNKGYCFRYRTRKDSESGKVFVPFTNAEVVGDDSDKVEFFIKPSLKISNEDFEREIDSENFQHLKEIRFHISASSIYENFDPKFSI